MSNPHLSFKENPSSEVKGRGGRKRKGGLRWKEKGRGRRKDGLTTKVKKSK